MNDSYQHYPRHRAGYAPEAPPAPSPPQSDAGYAGYGSHEDYSGHEAYASHTDYASRDDVNYENYEYDEDVAYEEPRRRRVRGVLAAMVALVVIVAALAFGGSKAFTFLKDHFSGGGGGSDYAAGKAHGSVKFTVQPSESGTEMGRELKQLGVVESVDAFIDAYEDNPKATSIAPGTYRLQLQMPAAAAITSLLDARNLVQTKIMIREGLRATDIVALLDKQTKYTLKDFKTVLAHPSWIGLPASADGNAEGYLFPATYGFAPGTEPRDMLSEMVSTWHQEATKLGLTDASTDIDAHAYTVQQIMTVASLVQEEGKTPGDMAKIARVIYNRIEHPGAEGQDGSLQIDSTVDYAMGRPLTVGLTDQDRTVDSPYNTFLHTGLPPGPIANPGAAAINAAMHPAKGDWYYYITVNLASGKTEFAHTYNQFLQLKAAHEQYCATQSASGCQ